MIQKLILLFIPTLIDSMKKQEASIDPIENYKQLLNKTILSFFKGLIFSFFMVILAFKLIEDFHVYAQTLVNGLFYETVLHAVLFLVFAFSFISNFAKKTEAPANNKNFEPLENPINAIQGFGKNFLKGVITGYNQNKQPTLNVETRGPNYGVNLSQRL